MTAEQKVLIEAREASQRGIQILRDALKKEFAGRDDFLVGVNGSYARGEVTIGSDVDIFFMGMQSVAPAIEAQERFAPLITELGFKPPAGGGVFENALPVSALRDNIGGSEDTNETITRRMLYLLEGEWLFNEQGFAKTRREIINAYVEGAMGEGHLSKYLLNDVVRYWRTICVDYEGKARFRGKARGIRYIKLRFSRLLLYFAGVLAVAETWDRPTDQKADILVQMFARSPLERVRSIAGSDADAAIGMYCQFLEALADKASLDELNVLGPGYSETSTYKRLRQVAGEFREELIRLLYKKYGSEHEIVKALPV